MGCNKQLGISLVMRAQYKADSRYAPAALSLFMTSRAAGTENTEVDRGVLMLNNVLQEKSDIQIVERRKLSFMLKIMYSTK